MINYIQIGYESHSPKQNNNRNILFYIRNGCSENLFMTCSWPFSKIYRKHTRHFVWSFILWPNFSNPWVLTWLFFMENIYKIISHLFLGNQHLLTSINNKVSALIKHAFFVLYSILIRTHVQSTIIRSNHDWNPPYENTLMLLLILHNIFFEGSIIVQGLFLHIY